MGDESASVSCAHAAIFPGHLTGEGKARWDRHPEQLQEKQAAGEWRSLISRFESSFALLEVSCLPPGAA